jgi:hypothetical protein
MTCLPVASTGLPVFALLSLAGIFLLAGLLSLVLARSPRGRLAIVAVVLMLVSGGVASALGGARSVRAATPACSAAATSALLISQSSILTGLAPGVAPVVITGVIVNNSSHRVTITRVTVSITSVTAMPTAARGRCDASDYVLLRPTMSVDRILAPGGSVRFGGAAIGFRDEAVNQDACQRARVALRYASS